MSKTPLTTMLSPVSTKTTRRRCSKEWMFYSMRTKNLKELINCWIKGYKIFKRKRRRKITILQNRLKRHIRFIKRKNQRHNKPWRILRAQRGCRRCPWLPDSRSLIIEKSTRYTIQLVALKIKIIMRNTTSKNTIPASLALRIWSCKKSQNINMTTITSCPERLQKLEQGWFIWRGWIWSFFERPSCLS